MLAILFGSIVVPATAHAGDMVVSHTNEMFSVVDHVEDSSEHRENHKQTGDAPCHAVSHHHCSSALASDGLSIALGLWLSDALLMPLDSSAMASLSQAPPTEPPAA